MREPSRVYHIPEDKAKKKISLSSSVLFWRGPSRFRRRRVLSIALIISIIYLFLKYQPPGLHPVENGPHRGGFDRPPHIPPPPPLTRSPQGQPTKDENAELDASSNHYYNGPI